MPIPSTNPGAAPVQDPDAGSNAPGGSGDKLCGRKCACAQVLCCNEWMCPSLITCACVVIGTYNLVANLWRARVDAKHMHADFEVARFDNIANINTDAEKRLAAPPSQLPLPTVAVVPLHLRYVISPFWRPSLLITPPLHLKVLVFLALSASSYDPSQMDGSRYTLSPSPPCDLPVADTPKTVADMKQELALFAEDVANAFGIQPEYRKHLHILLNVSVKYSMTPELTWDYNNTRLHPCSLPTRCVLHCTSSPLF
jgi:hypothetical protein